MVRHFVDIKGMDNIHNNTNQTQNTVHVLEASDTDQTEARYQLAFATPMYCE